jgi:hypothetical protein
MCIAVYVKYRVNKKSLHLMITIQEVASPHYLAESDCLAAGRQGQGDTRLTLTPSVIYNSNYVIMVGDLLLGPIGCCPRNYCSHEGLLH